MATTDFALTNPIILAYLKVKEHKYTDIWLQKFQPLCMWYSVPTSRLCHWWQINQRTIITEENCRKEMAYLQNQHFGLSRLSTWSILVPPLRSFLFFHILLYSHSHSSTNTSAAVSVNPPTSCSSSWLYIRHEMDAWHSSLYPASV